MSNNYLLLIPLVAIIYFNLPKNEKEPIDSPLRNSSSTSSIDSNIVIIQN